MCQGLPATKVTQVLQQLVGLSRDPQAAVRPCSQQLAEVLS